MRFAEEDVRPPIWFKVTDDDLDAPDGARVYIEEHDAEYERCGDYWVVVSQGLPEDGLGCSHDLAQVQGENLRLRIALGLLCRAVRREWKPLECSGALFSALGVAEHVLGPEADL